MVLPINGGDNSQLGGGAGGLTLAQLIALIEAGLPPTVEATSQFATLTQLNSVQTLTIGQILSRVFHVDNFGAVGNATQITSSFTITSGSAVLNASTSVFTGAMTGQTICLPGAGASVAWPTGTVNGSLIAVMTYNSPQQVTLSVAASASLSAVPLTVTIGNDDSAAFVTGFNSLSVAGGGALQISEQKRYFIASEQVVMPVNTHLTCQSYTQGNATYNYSDMAGVIILPPGAPISGAVGSNYYNRQRTSMALSMSDTCKVSNIAFFSANYYFVNNVVQCESMVDGYVTNGNGVQLDGNFCEVHNCFFVGLNQGVVNVPQKVTTANFPTSGAYVGAAGASPRVEKVEGDCSTLLILGNNGLGGYCNRLRAMNFGTAGAGIGGGANLTFNVGTDGAGGTLLSSLAWKGTTIAWPSTFIGTPVAGATVTLSILNGSSDPVSNTSDTRTPPSNRYSGVWVSNGSGGWNIQIPNMPNGNWGQVAAGTGSSAGQIIDVTPSAPAKAAFSAASFRSGPSIYLDNIQSAKISNVDILDGYGIYIQQSGSIHLDGITGDGPTGVDCGGACSGYAFFVDANSGGIAITNGYINNTFGGICNLSTFQPGGGVSLSNFSFSGPLILINQQGNAITMTGGSLGQSGYVVCGAAHAGLTLNAVTLPPFNSGSGGARLLTSVASSALPIYVDPNCPGASLNGGAITSVNFVANTIGGLPMDNSASSVLTLSAPMLTQQQGASLPGVLLANNSNLPTPTTGYYWTQADATAGGGTVNLGALLTAACSWSATNGRKVRIPGGEYDLSSTQISVTQDNVGLIFDKDSRITWGYGTTSSAAFTITGRNFCCQGGVWGPIADTYQDFFTSQILQTPATYGPSTTADLTSWRTLSCGVWAGLTVLLQWQTSATQLFQVNTNVTYHDVLPINPATSVQFATLAALQAYLNAQTLVVGQSNQFLCNIPQSTAAPTITGGSVSLVTIGAWTGYQVTYTPPSGTTYAVINTSPGPLPGLPRTMMSSAGPTVCETAAIAQPTINFLSGQPVFHNGGAFVVQGDDAVFEDIEMRNCSGARMLVTNKANRTTVRRFRAYASDGTTGSAYLRFTAGDGHLVDDFIIFSGDQSCQFVAGSAWTGNGFTSTSNLNISNSRFVNGVAACMGGGPTLSAVLNIGNSKQYVGWYSGALTSPVGNTLYLPDAIPSGLSATILQYSSPPWGNSTAYTIGYLVTNGTSQYSCTTAGTSSASGNGPSGTGGTITDGTCVWAYVSGSAGNATSQYISNLTNIGAGSCVTGYSHSGTTNTLTLTPPAGQTYAIHTAITTNAKCNFIAGTPLGALTNSIKNCSYDNVYVLTVGSIGASIQNSDSQGTIDISYIDCVFDASWCNSATFDANTGKGLLWINGGAYGGASYSLVNCKFVQPWQSCVYTYGTINKGSIIGCTFEPPQMGASAPNPTLYLCGTNVTTLPGAALVVDNNTVWAPQGAGWGCIELGQADTVDGLGQAVPGSTYNATLINNRLYGVNNATPAVRAAYGGSHLLEGNVVFPSVTGGSDTAQFLSVRNTMVGQIMTDKNTLTNINGSPFVVQSGGTFPGLYSLFDIYNPSHMGTFNPPAQFATWLTTTFPQSLATTLPSASGTLWNDGGQEAIS